MIKTSETLLWAVLGATAAITGVLLWKQLSAKSNQLAKQEIESWVEQRLSESLSPKLSRSASEIRTALTEHAHTELMSRIERLLSSIELLFSRQSPSIVTMRLRASYQDGTQFSASVQKNWDDLPDDIRSRFLRTTDSKIVVPWMLFSAETTMKNIHEDRADER